jgi:ABC-2 type transport system ATP-binding protein
MPDLAIETSALQKQFGATPAVADLTLKIPRGEVFGFLGPNGAGKTTSIKLLLGLVPPGGGTGRVLGQPLGDRPTRGRIGFLPEHFRFHDTLTGRELLRFHGRLYGLRGEVLENRIDLLLQRVDLADAADRLLAGYSKGMLQRIGLAQALVNDPELVFLDEPTSGLDPLGRRLVRDLVDELRGQGTTVFLNSHLLGEVEATCDRVVFVKAGRTVRELVLAGEHSGLHVEMRVDAATPVRALEGLSRFGTDLSFHDGTVRLRVLHDDVVPAIARWLVTEGVPLYGLKSGRPSLEEIFLDVMGDDQRPG